MNEASVTQDSVVTDAICLELLSLLLEAASMSAEAPPPDAWVRRLADAFRESPAMQQWMEDGECPSPSPEASTSFSPWAGRFPEIVAQRGQHLPIATPHLAQSLLQAAHVAVRLRACEHHFLRELQMRQTESIYHFAYGLSHELNNPLANIATRAGVLARDEKDRARLELLDSIVENAMRGSEMLGDLMLVARPPSLELKLVPADAFFEELLKHARQWVQAFSITIRDQIDLVGSLDIDVAAMREALWSLLRNSIEALSPGGEILVKARRLAEDRIEISIRDNGSQLSPEALEHGFDPFYSGREAGRGLGLGLTKAQRIVQLHRGELRLANVPGGGCAATIELPC